MTIVTQKESEVNMKIITTTNSKLGGNIAQVNMPPWLTCRLKAPCLKECYAIRGNFAFPKVKDGILRRYEMYKANPKAFFDMINMEMEFISYKYFRWHSSGDIVDMEYLDLMCKLARKQKGTMFLCFTKKYELVNEYLDHHRKPNNLTIVLSAWAEWKPENPHNLPMSYVDFGDGKGIPEFAYECSGNCGNCPGTHCWHMKKGDSVVFHKH